MYLCSELILTCQASFDILFYSLFQMGDDSSLSEEPRTRLNVSYAIEEPPNRTALDASFVSLHVSEQSNLRNTQNSPQNVYLEDTVVDEEIARDLNISISQRFSQTVDRSLTCKIILFGHLRVCGLLKGHQLH